LQHVPTLLTLQVHDKSQPCNKHFQQNCEGNARLQNGSFLIAGVPAGGYRVEPKTLPVGLSEARAVKGKVVLTCESIGSGVALCLYDPDSQVGGLAHVLLDKPSGQVDPGTESRYAATVVEKLLADMENLGAQREKVTANIVGGAEVHTQDPDLFMGSRVLQTMRDSLKQADIPLLTDTSGGHLTRSVWLHPEHGRIELRTFVDHGVLDWEVAA